MHVNPLASDSFFKGTFSNTLPRNRQNESRGGLIVRQEVCNAEEVLYDSICN